MGWKTKLKTFFGLTIENNVDNQEPAAQMRIPTGVGFLLASEQNPVSVTFPAKGEQKFIPDEPSAVSIPDDHQEVKEVSSTTRETLENKIVEVRISSWDYIFQISELRQADSYRADFVVEGVGSISRLEATY